MATLVIVESPNKTKKLSAVLGGQFRVVASVGHVRDLPEKEIGVAAPDYRPGYVPTKKGKEVLARLREEVKKADNVILATDPDREGEAIAWHLREALKLPATVKRVTYTSMDKDAILPAFANPRSLDMDRVRAQEARRVLDRLVGYLVSPALADRTGQPLSAGRVQTPAVRLVVERERAIQAFKPTTHYGVSLVFPGGWTAEWDTKPHRAPDSDYLLDLAVAEQVAKIRHVTVAAYADTFSRKAPPAPFTTSTLQQAAAARLKLKTKAVMDAAQELFAAGHITYHRTDSPNMDPAGVADVATYARDAGLPLAPKPRTWKAKEGAQEGHEAIRPTHADVLTAGDDDMQRAVYKLIWSRAVASQLEDAVYAVRTATLTGTTEDGTAATFVGRGRTPVSPGWQAVYAEDKDDEEGEGEGKATNPVPELATGQAVVADDANVLHKSTKAPPRYTEGTLVKAMEDHGIGRPSTYAAIMENITRREYITADKKGFLSPTMRALAIVDAVVGSFAFAELEYTRGLEAELDRIAEGKANYAGVVGGAHQNLVAEIGTLTANAGPVQHPCPDCGKAMRLRGGQNGPFWACTGFPDCRTTLPDDKGSPGQRKAAATSVASTHKCDKCKKPLQRKTVVGKFDFFGCTGYPKCKATFNVSPDGLPIYKPAAA